MQERKNKPFRGRPGGRPGKIPGGARPHWRDKKPEKVFDPAEPVWIYGHHAVHAALANPARNIARLVATQNAARQIDPVHDPEILDAKAIDKLLPADAVHQGVALLAEPLAQPPLKLLLAAAGGRPILFLDQVTDPHNVGAILRSAAAFGAAAVITTRRHAPPVTGVLAKAASGALEHVPYVQETNLAEAMLAAREAGYIVLGFDENGADLESIARERPVALVFGAEGAGLRERTRETCDALVRLRTGGTIGALNVSNAAAVALYAVSVQAKAQGMRALR